eukprot:g15456.t1
MKFFPHLNGDVSFLDLEKLMFEGGVRKPGYGQKRRKLKIAPGPQNRDAGATGPQGPPHRGDNYRERDRDTYRADDRYRGRDRGYDYGRGDYGGGGGRSGKFELTAVVSMIPRQATPDDLYRYFSEKCGRVVDVKFVPGNATIACVQFAEQRAMDKAVSGLANPEVCGAPVKIRASLEIREEMNYKPRKQMQKLFQPFGDIEGVFVRDGTCDLTFRATQSATDATNAMDGFQYMGDFLRFVPSATEENRAGTRFLLAFADFLDEAMPKLNNQHSLDYFFKQRNRKGQQCSREEVDFLGKLERAKKFLHHFIELHARKSGQLHLQKVLDQVNKKYKEKGEEVRVDAIAIWVRAQNAMLFVESPKEHPEVMSPGFWQKSIPEKRGAVSGKLINIAFAQMVAELANNEDPLAFPMQKSKGGNRNRNPEENARGNMDCKATSSVARPIFVTEYLFAALGAKEQTIRSSGGVLGAAALGGDEDRDADASGNGSGNMPTLKGEGDARAGDDSDADADLAAAAATGSGASKSKKQSNAKAASGAKKAAAKKGAAAAKPKASSSSSSSALAKHKATDPDSTSFPALSKKVRDQVQGGFRSAPWRRSPSMTALKTALHFYCVHILGSEEVYKRIWLRFHCWTLQKVAQGGRSLLSGRMRLSSISEAARKIVRRRAKLLDRGHGEMLMEAEQEQIRKALEAARQMVSDHDQRCLAAGGKDAAVRVFSGDVARDQIHKLENSLEIVQILNAELRKVAGAGGDGRERDNVEERRGAEEDASSEQEPAKPQKFRLPRQHIDSTSEARVHLRYGRLQETFSQLSKECQRALSLPDAQCSAIDVAKLLFAAEETMTKAHTRIQAECAQRATAKREQFRSLNDEFNRLTLTINANCCECIRDDFTRKVVTKCRRHRAQESRNKLRLTPYTKLLPRNEYAQWAVIYEMFKCDELRAVDEMFLVFAEHLFPDGKKCRVTSDARLLAKQAPWDEDAALTKVLGQEVHDRCLDKPLYLFAGGHGRASESNKDAKRVDHFLQSEGVRERTGASAYIRIPREAHRRAYNPTTGSMDELAPLDVSSCPQLLPRSTWLWRLDHFFEPFLQTPRYAALQPFVGFKHNENQVNVLALQSEAFADTRSGSIGLREWQELGKLRAGSELQLERLARILQQGFVILNSEDVSLFIISTLWQTGPPLTEKALKQVDSNSAYTYGSGNNSGLLQMAGSMGHQSTKPKAEDALWRRSAFRRLGVPGQSLSDDLCRHARAVLGQIRENWNSSVTLLNVTLLALTVLEHQKLMREGATPNAAPQSPVGVAPAAAGSSSSSIVAPPQPNHSTTSSAAAAVGILMKQVRGTAELWIGKLRQIANLCTSEDEIQGLRRKTVDIAATACLTFSADDSLLLHSSSDCEQWLFFRAVFQDHVSVSDYKPECKWRRLAILEADTHAHAMFPKLASLAKAENGKAPTNFVRKYWSGAAGHDSPGKWTKLGAWEGSPWFRAKFASCWIDIDIVDGTFLIDGAPCKRLPRSIVDDPLYARTFGAAIFGVQPVGGGVYKTAVEVDGAWYYFKEGADGGARQPVIIEERGGVKSILLEHSIFQGGKKKTSKQVGGGPGGAGENEEDSDSGDGGEEGDAEDGGFGAGGRTGGATARNSLPHMSRVGIKQEPNMTANGIEHELQEPDEEFFDDPMGMEIDGVCASTPAMNGITADDDDLHGSKAAARQARHSGSGLLYKKPAGKKKPKKNPKKTILGADPDDPDFDGELSEELQEDDSNDTNLPDDFPDRFIHLYSHWLVQNVDESPSWSIHFRPIRYNDAGFGKSAPDFVFHSDSMTLVETRSNRRLLDINSESVGQMVKNVFGRLGRRKDIHFFGNLESSDCPELILMVLCTGRNPLLPMLVPGDEDFGAEDYNIIIAPDHDQMQVPRKQTLGTLRGLDSYLLLTKPTYDYAAAGGSNANIIAPGSDSSSRKRKQSSGGAEEEEDDLLSGGMKKQSGSGSSLNKNVLLNGDEEEDDDLPLQACIVLVPHGEVFRNVRNGSVFVDLDKLQKPPLFQYEVRRELKDLHPQQSRIASVYLALLHATTARLTADPFTECSGTTRAMEILRSARVRGNITNRLDNTDLDALRVEFEAYKTLLQLSPERWADPPHSPLEATNLGYAELEPLAANAGLAGLAHIRALEIRRALILTGKLDAFVDLLEGGEGAGREDSVTAWETAAKKRLEILNLRAYLRYCDWLPVEEQLTRKELEGAFCVSLNPMARTSKADEEEDDASRGGKRSQDDEDKDGLLDAGDDFLDYGDGLDEDDQKQDGNERRKELQDDRKRNQLDPNTSLEIESKRELLAAFFASKVEPVQVPQIGFDADGEAMENMRVIGRSALWKHELLADTHKQTLAVKLRDEVARAFTQIEHDEKKTALQGKSQAGFCLQTETNIFQLVREMQLSAEGLKLGLVDHFLDLYTFFVKGQPNQITAGLRANFFFCRLLLQWPEAYSLVLQLRLMTYERSFFSQLKAPGYASYTACGHLELSEVRVETIIDEAATPFRAPFGVAEDSMEGAAMQQQHAGKLATAEAYLQKLVSACMEQTKSLPTAALEQHVDPGVIPDSVSLAKRLNNTMHDVRAAGELQTFCESWQSQLKEALTTTQNKAENIKFFFELHHTPIADALKKQEEPAAGRAAATANSSSSSGVMMASSARVSASSTKSATFFNFNTWLSSRIAAARKKGTAAEYCQALKNLPKAEPSVADVQDMIARLGGGDHDQSAATSSSSSSTSQAASSSAGTKKRKVDPSRSDADVDVEAKEMNHPPLALPRIGDNYQYKELTSRILNELNESWQLAHTETGRAVDSLPLETLHAGTVMAYLQTKLVEAGRLVDECWAGVEAGLLLLAAKASRNAGGVGISSSIPPAQKQFSDFVCDAYSCGIACRPTPTATLRSWGTDMVELIDKTSSSTTNAAANSNSAAAAAGGSRTACVKNSSGEQALLATQHFSVSVLRYGVALRNLLRLKRIARAFERRDWKQLQNELDEPGSRGWEPFEFPEWLLFELDNDLVIRRSQANVSQQLVFGTQNRLLQMNMGEGKTAVVLPIALLLASRSEKIARATVLQSLSATNFSEWQWKLGGLLNCKLAPLLFRRDLQITERETAMMLEDLEQLRTSGSVLVTVPEHRLSLENKILELAAKSSQKQDLAASRGLFAVSEFLQRFCHDFLDESDEVLSVKYSLIYTLGSAEDVAGGQRRWDAACRVLRAASTVAPGLKEKWGADVVEFHEHATAGGGGGGVESSGTDETPAGEAHGSGDGAAFGGKNGINGQPTQQSQLARASAALKFRPLRLLDHKKQQDAFEDLKLRILDEVSLSESSYGGQMEEVHRKAWRRAVLADEPKQYLEKLPETYKETALILRGLLTYEVLLAVLKKRHRVNYGTHPTRSGFHMAVPFVAKDKASDRTEYGHLDIALQLTAAAHLQEGLTEQALRDAFVKLSTLSDSQQKHIYETWAAELLKAGRGVGATSLGSTSNMLRPRDEEIPHEGAAMSMNMNSNADGMVDLDLDEDHGLPPLGVHLDGEEAEDASTVKKYCAQLMQVVARKPHYYSLFKVCVGQQKGITVKVSLEKANEENTLTIGVEILKLFVKEYNPVAHVLFGKIRNPYIKEPLPKAVINAREKLLMGGIEAEEVDEISALLKYESVNIDDRHFFKTKLYPAFRKHPSVIEFWLFRVVFPAQARQYSEKIVSTAWDLCRSKEMSCDAITVGFSGTDDLKAVLPCTIIQKNLESLKATNGLQLKRLFQPENDRYHPLMDECHQSAAEQILDFVAQDSTISVVLDPGALILQLGNRDFVRRWLRKRPDALAAVYFDENDVAQVLLPDTAASNDEEEILFKDSAFSKNMAGCLLYLDDNHTRGTDFPLPKDAHGVLTLGPDVDKAKLLQACMRERYLGRGQRLTFVASQEAHRCIEQIRKEYEAGNMMQVERVVAQLVAGAGGDQSSATEADAVDAESEGDDPADEPELPVEKAATGAKNPGRGTDTAKAKSAAAKAKGKASAKKKQAAPPAPAAAKKQGAKQKPAETGKAKAKAAAAARTGKTAGKKAESSSPAGKKDAAARTAQDRDSSSEQERDLKQKITALKMLTDMGIGLSAHQQEQLQEWEGELEELKNGTCSVLSPPEDDVGAGGGASRSGASPSAASSIESSSLAALGQSKNLQNTTTTATGCIPAANKAPNSISSAPRLQYVPSILSWAIRNTVHRICDMIPYYALQGRNCLLKRQAEAKHLAAIRNKARAESSTAAGGMGNLASSGSAAAALSREKAESKALEKLAGDCIEPETTSLEEFYGHARIQQSLPQIVENRLRVFTKADEPVMSSCKSASGGGSASASAKAKASAKTAKNKSNIATSACRDFAKSITDNVNTIAPKVLRFASMFDEEQERELEQEQEEERHTQRPAPAVAADAFVSDGLEAVARQVRDNRPCVDFQKYFQPLSALLAETSLGLTFRVAGEEENDGARDHGGSGSSPGSIENGGLQAASAEDSGMIISNVNLNATGGSTLGRNTPPKVQDAIYYTKGWADTVGGGVSVAGVAAIGGNANQAAINAPGGQQQQGQVTDQKLAYMKMPDWLVRCRLPSAPGAGSARAGYLIISNHEAERLFSNSHALLAFSATVRMDQDPVLVQDRSLAECEWSSKIPTTIAPNTFAALHLLAGSVYADADTMRKIEAYLAILPRWRHEVLFKTLARSGHVALDGFVGSKSARQMHVPAFVDSPFTTSQSQGLRNFVGTARHLQTELATSPLGKLLGCDKLAE